MPLRPCQHFSAKLEVFIGEVRSKLLKQIEEEENALTDRRSDLGEGKIRVAGPAVS